MSSLFASAGCWPVQFTKVPEFRGRAVDANDEPLAGATVNVYAVNVIHPPGGPPVRDPDKLLATATTDANGAFATKEERGWGLYIVPMDVFGIDVRVDLLMDGEVVASGADWFRPHLRFFGIGGTQGLDFGAIQSGTFEDRLDQ